MAENKNVIIALDDSVASEMGSSAFEDYLGSLSEDVVFIRSEDNKSIFMTESADAFLVQEHF